ncbi:histone-like nucleoid-structuring protein Lsr2 [Gordonia otitidis]|uniref:LSR2-like protein n=1 Tax=Gordonia otitidis (strain DSM 44809 / CCUG 52243 / JCM 12355 / NBRC 100426 / IFM 10032) TaxID=1108044 RepID=H5TT49_GORO1|nr:Lsr2 family protein [Gordonia otitidis]UEA58275.1 Lsr2 family protein [Gordonia otitidis]GAB36657.1 putative LSR2-like protein [Gordonia otitidis NBRC 100426]
MAKRKVVKFVDDLDGAELEEAVTVVFGLNGKQYEFDTSPAHAKEFAQSLQKYLAVSRLANESGKQGRPSKRAHPRTQAIRAWARENGYEISNRGRISSEIVSAFEAAV